ncbi:MAG: hypothetical protein A2X49_04215 [Lentisphaerae bacterium GWF2_52_8]|nr:MAG: hypothetical protein A2X49_04215 [Lentisphaerae bacterium GWF2_52_8]
MMKSGLVSITFRQLPPSSIIDLVAKAGLTGIEWGGDIHVPHGDLAMADKVRKNCEDSGLEIPAYGSYYRAGSSEKAGLPFTKVLDTAKALNALTIRVWAGGKDSASLSSLERGVIVEDILRIGEAARKAGISVSLEYHRGTLTDSRESVQMLLRELAGAKIRFYWQPPVFVDEASCLVSLKEVLPLLSNLHVFHWLNKPGNELERRPLSEAVEKWREYLSLASTSGTPHCAMLEFVRGDSPDQFLEDAATLKDILKYADQTES